jgi:hypothetical protein
MSNLRLINETTASNVANVSVTDVFTSDFDIYKLVINNTDLTTSGVNTQIIMRFINSSGSVISTANYDFAYQNLKPYAVFTEGKNTNQTGIEGNIWLGEDTADSGGTVIYIFNPNNSSSYTFSLFQSFSTLISDNGYATKGIGVLKQTSSISGFYLYLGTGSFDTITAKTYGLRVDS